MLLFRRTIINFRLSEFLDWTQSQQRCIFSQGKKTESVQNCSWIIPFFGFSASIFHKGYFPTVKSLPFTNSELIYLICLWHSRLDAHNDELFLTWPVFWCFSFFLWLRFFSDFFHISYPISWVVYFSVARARLCKSDMRNWGPEGQPRT